MEIKNYDAIVVGAGFAGAVIAERLANNNYKVLVIDKRNHIAGNMFEEEDENGVRIHRYGPHIFHTNNKDVFDYLKNFSEWFFYEHKVLGLIDGKHVPIPFNFKSIDMLFTKEKAEIFKEKLKTTYPNETKISILTLKEASDEVLKELGEYVFEKVFVNYTAKQWGIPIEEVDISTINRVPVTLGYDERYFQDEYQFMPKDGYTSLIEKMLNHKNINIRLNINAKDYIKFKENTFYFDDIECTVPFIFTGAVDEILEYKYGPLPYRSLNLVFENYQKEFYQQGAVVNYPNDEDFTRITEFKYLTNQEVDSTTILKEYPQKFDYKLANIPYYPINNPTNIALFEKYKESLSIYKNFYLCGRLAEYKYYNMDGVIAQALKVANEIIK